MVGTLIPNFSPTFIFLLHLLRGVLVLSAIGIFDFASDAIICPLSISLILYKHLIGMVCPFSTFVNQSL